MQQRRSDPTDLTEIVAQHRARVRRVLRARGVAERDLPDAEQDVFLVVHRKLAEFEGRSSLATWLHRIAIHVASEHRRRARHRYELLQGESAPEVSGPDPDARLQAREALARVCIALEALSAEQREAFLLHEVGGLPMHEVAAQLHVPLKTAFSRFYAARRALAATFGPRELAVSTLGVWWLLSLPSRLLSRASALATAFGRAAQVQIASVALVCSMLPAWVAPPSAPNPAAVAAAQLAAPVNAQHVIVARVESAPASPAPDAVAPSAPPRVPKRAVRRAPPVMLASAEPALAEPEFEPEPAPFAADDGLIVTRSGAVDLRPIVESPLGAHLPPVRALRAPARIALRGPADAASALEASLADSRVP